MPNSEQDVAQPNTTPLKPMPEHLYDALLVSLRTTLGAEWGVSDRVHAAHARQIRDSLQDVGGAYIVGDAELDAQGLHVDVWVDVAELSPTIADAVAAEALHGPDGQEIFLVCRTYEDDGIRYRFARGSIEAGMIGSVRLIGPYARDVARLGRIGSGQITSFSA